jgi:hypothetical protein
VDKTDAIAAAARARATMKRRSRASMTRRRLQHGSGVIGTQSPSERVSAVEAGLAGAQAQARLAMRREERVFIGISVRRFRSLDGVLALPGWVELEVFGFQS